MFLLILLLLFIFCTKENYQNYIDYDNFDQIHICPENYEKGIHEIIKLRDKRPNVLLSDLGYSDIDDFNTRINYIYSEPLPSPPDLFYKQ